MRKVWIIISMITLLGCSTLESALESATQAVTNLEQASMEAVSLTPAMEISLFYAAYFFLGGYGFGDDNFQEGEGIKWKIVNQDGKEVIVTRALLKSNGDGSAWWFLQAEVEEETNFYEMQLTSDYDIIKVRFKDKESGEIKEYIPEPGEEEETEEELEQLDSDFYKDYVLGEEQIKTRAGSFKAKHMAFEDEEEQFKSNYWISDRVPGHLVKYEYTNTAEGETVRGEIVDIRGGYRTQLSSY